MTTIRAFEAEDLFRFNHINLDPLTETYTVSFYLVSTLCITSLPLHTAALATSLEICTSVKLFLFFFVELLPFFPVLYEQQYVATWPSLCAVFEDNNQRMMGYILGTDYHCDYHSYTSTLLCG